MLPVRIYARDGAAWLDTADMDTLIRSAPNDVMDLHTDIRSGETKNTTRLIDPDGKRPTVECVSFFDPHYHPGTQDIRIARHGYSSCSAGL